MKKLIAAIGLAFILLICCAAALSEQPHVHSYDWNYYEYDGTYHWRVCLECGEKLYYTAHYVHCTNQNKRICEDCGAVLTEDAPTTLHGEFELRHDIQYHWMECAACGEIRNIAAHTGTCSQPGICTVCGATEAEGAEVISASHIYVQQHDELGHWSVCKVCGTETEKEDHFASCANPDECLQCGALKSEGADIPQPDHDWQLQMDAKYHWDECSVCGLITAREQHYALCTMEIPHLCAVCGAAEEDGAAVAPPAHYYSDPMDFNEDSHWYVCVMCGEKINESPHVFEENECIFCGFLKTVEPTATPAPETSDEPTVTPAPETSDEPTATPAPETSDEPTATPTPEASDEPTATPAPDITPKPTATPTPDITPKPTATPTPDITPKPTATPAPTPDPNANLTQQLPLYTVEDIFFDGSYISGRAVHEEGTPEAEQLFVRLELILPDGSDLVIVIPVTGEEGAFEAAFAGNVKISRLVLTDTIHCVRPDDVWNQLGMYAF